MTGIKCVEFSAGTARAVIIEPGHPDYERLKKRDDDAAWLMATWQLEHEAIRGAGEMLIAQLLGRP